MYSLLEPIIQWIFKKLLLLAGILLILVAGFWVKSEWPKVSAIGTKIAEIEKEIAGEEGKTTGYLRDLKQLDPENPSLKNLNTLEGIAAAAEAIHKQVAAETHFWHFGFTAQGLKYNSTKEIAHATRKAADRVQDLKNNLLGTDRPVIQRLIIWTRDSAPIALGILVGVIIVPWILKGIFFFVLAPIADKLPPIRIHGDAPAECPVFVPSAVSQTIELQPGQELLIRAEFLQSSTKPSKKHTRWFLNHRLPLTSAISGMTVLTSIRPHEEEPTSVVISSTKDALGEVGIVTIPEGSSMVMHPRALAGVVKSLNSPVQISSAWRLCNLHSWLTLQLRYLVFHGPCALILKGCRGVKTELPDPKSARLLNQSATLGFSAHLEYSNTRCETFMSYLMGKEDLFNDQFAGENGVFVYEEMPDLRRKSGLTGRGIEGFLDSVLKVFGI